MAGEFSFIITENDIKKGELSETFASQSGVPALCKMVAEAKKLKEEEIDGHRVFKYANNGDEEVLKILDDYCFKLAIQLHNLQHIYDPEKIAIGGGISKQDILFEYIQKNIDRVADALPYVMAKPHVVKCKFDNESNLIGALAVYLTTIN